MTKAKGGKPRTTASASLKEAVKAVESWDREDVSILRGLLLEVEEFTDAPAVEAVKREDIPSAPLPRHIEEDDCIAVDLKGWALIDGGAGLGDYRTRRATDLRGGRPSSRTTPISLRLTDEEHRATHEAMLSKGMYKKTTFIREIYIAWLQQNGFLK